MAEEPELQPEKDPSLSKVEEAVVRQYPKLFQNIPKNQRQEMLRAVVSVTKIHSGPLPPVELIQGYEELTPGSAKMIFDLFERQSNHRMKMEDLVITSQQAQSGRGQHYALIIAILFLTAAAICVLEGHDAAGGAIGSIDVVGMVAIFITGRNKQSSNLKEKDLQGLKNALANVSRQEKPIPTKKRNKG